MAVSRDGLVPTANCNGDRINGAARLRRSTQRADLGPPQPDVDTLRAVGHPHFEAHAQPARLGDREEVVEARPVVLALGLLHVAGRAPHALGEVSLREAGARAAQ